MSVIAGVAKAAGAKVLTRTRPTTRVLPRTVRTFVMIALALLGLVAFAASQGTNAEHSSVASTDYQSETAPVSGPAASQMSEQEALDAYGKLAYPSCPTRARQRRRCATTPRVLVTASTSPKRGLCSPSPKGRAQWPRAGTGLPGCQPPRDARSPKAAFRGGQLPTRERTWQVAAGATNPRRAPLRGSVVWD